jgi:hypothetical protein
MVVVFMASRRIKGKIEVGRGTSGGPRRSLGSARRALTSSLSLSHVQEPGKMQYMSLNTKAEPQPTAGGESDGHFIR